MNSKIRDCENRQKSAGRTLTYLRMRPPEFSRQVSLPSAFLCPLPCALSASIHSSIHLLCCLRGAPLLVPQCLSGDISVRVKLMSRARPTSQSLHSDKVCSALASTAGGLQSTESCSVCEVQARFAFSGLVKLLVRPW